MTGKTTRSARAAQDILGGALLIAIALAGLYLSSPLPAGGPSGFSSGTAPRLAAYAVMALGFLIMIGGFFREGPRIEGFALRATLCIPGGVLFFALAIQPLGLILTGIPLMLIAALAAPDFRWKEGLAFAIGITLFCALLFPLGLSQAIPVWPNF